MKQQELLKNKNNTSTEKSGIGVNSNSNSNSNKASNDTKSTTKKKRKGFGKNLLDQGVGKLKQRLVGICHSTGRSFELVNESYTTLTCCNCDQETGPRGLKQLGIREWVCSGCQTHHKRDVCAAKNMLRVKYMEAIRAKRKRLAQTHSRSLSGQASVATNDQRVGRTLSMASAARIRAADGSSLRGKNTQ